MAELRSTRKTSASSRSCSFGHWALPAWRKEPIAQFSLKDVPPARAHRLLSCPVLTSFTTLRSFSRTTSLLLLLPSPLTSHPRSLLANIALCDASSRYTTPLFDPLNRLACPTHIYLRTPGLSPAVLCFTGNLLSESQSARNFAQS